jgi:outer membrane protein insertion porin family
VGGDFMNISSIEYMFPITADDNLRGVVFSDFGTVESDVRIENFRASVGFGLRIVLAQALGPAPIALDFAVPVSHAPNDQIQNFSFFVGYSR